MTKKLFKISGMHCTACSLVIEGELDDVGVKARANYAKQTVEVEYDPKKITDLQIIDIVEKKGYKVVV